MPQVDNISDTLHKNLRLALRRYEARNGHSPGCIFMESDVFWLFRHFNSEAIMPNAVVNTFFGVPVKEVNGQGSKIYLSDGPIKLEAIEDTDIRIEKCEINF